VIPGSASQFFLGASQAASSAGGLQVSRSLRFDGGAYLNRTPASAGNRRTWTWAGWVKRSSFGNSGNQATRCCLFSAYINGSDYIFLTYGFSPADTLAIQYGGGNIDTAAVYRDPSAWMHVVFAVDTTQSTAGDRLKIYVNNVLQATSGATISQNSDLPINASGTVHTLGSGYYSAPTLFFNGYLANIHFIDGQALTPASFAETDATTGQWIPKAFGGGSYGTNGFYLRFNDNSTTAALGTDSSGNGNTWTTNNFSVTAGAGNDSLVDSPTNGSQSDTGVGGEVRGNYCTLNPLNAAHTYTNGNLDLTTSTAGFTSIGPAVGSIGVSSGKWYFEFTPTSITADPLIGITAVPATDRYPGYSAFSYGYYAYDGKKYNNSSASSYGNSWVANDVIGVAFDLDAGKLWFSKNGTWQASGNPSSGTNAAFTSITAGVYFPSTHKDYNGVNTFSGVFNFGQRAFAYTAPSGFKALCTQNLPAPLVTKSNTVMDVALWTGDGAARSITGLAFSPDLVWIKARSTSSYRNALFDAVRGANNRLISDLANAEDTGGGIGVVSAFNSNGFSLDGGGGTVNETSQTYVAWTWDAGTSTVTNTAGSITSTVRANATAGFSIVSYTGTGVTATIGHGLNSAPSLYIIKSRSQGSGYNWAVYHTALTATKFLRLNTTDSAITASTIFNDTAPTSSVFSIGNDVAVCGNGQNFIAYCFAPVVGYSNGFSYTGNGSTDGVFVYLGMRPKLLLIKRTDTTGNWYLWDTVRNTYNVVGEELYPNLSSAAATATDLDILSNGFKMRSTAADFNASGGTYVGFAWAESPFNYSRAR